MASTNRGRIAYVAESTFGTTPTNPTFQILRFTDSDLSYAKQTTESNELDSGRMLVDVPEVGASSSGSLNLELSPATYDDLIEAALCGTRSTAINVTAGNATISSASGTTATLEATGGFTNAEVGQRVLLQNFANAGNNGWKQITAINSADSVDLSGATTFVNEAASVAGTVKGQTIKNGTTERSFSIEESYLDVYMHRLFAGQRISSMALNIAAGSIITGSFSTMGTEVTTETEVDSTDPSWLGSGSRTGANTNQVLNATANIGDIIVDGTVSTACFQSLDLTIENGLRELQCLGQKFPSAINYGRQVVSGSFNKLFANWELYDKMYAHTDISLSFGVYNSAGGIHITIPRLTVSQDTINLSGGTDSDVQEQVNWSALRYYDSTNDEYYQIRIDIAG